MSEDGTAPAESTESIEAPVEETTEVKQPQTPEQNLKRKFMLKVDGQEFEEEYDLSNEEQIKKDLQLARAAKKRMSEANLSKKEFFELTQKIQKNPLAMIESMGDEGLELIEKMLWEKKIRQQTMSPEQIKQETMEQRLAKYEAQEKAQKEKEEDDTNAAIEAKEAQHYQKVIIDALDKSGLPKTPEMAKRAAFLLHKNLELGLDLDATELVAEMRKEVLDLVKSLVGSSEGEALLNLLGPETAKKIRKHDIATLKAKQIGGQNPTKPLYQSANTAAKKSRGYITQEEWQEEINQRMKAIAD